MRQYIGARYVPEFYNGTNGNEWDGDQFPYEALTVVTYLGNSYTSKKAVPVGVAITDTDYWCMTGAYSAQVEQYRQDVEAYEAAVSPLLNKKYLFFSDSFGEVPVGQTWIDNIVTYLGLTPGSYYTSSEGGSGFNHAGNNTGDNFEQRLTTLANGMTADERAEITDVVIVGGTNDCDSDSTVSGLSAAMQSFFTNCIPLFPNAVFDVFFAASLFIPTDDTVKAARNRKRSVRDIYTSICGSYKNVKIYPFADMSINWSHLYSDSVHPNAIGASTLARYVMRSLNGNSCFQAYDISYSGFTFSGMGSDNITIKIPSLSNVNIAAYGEYTIKAYDAADPVPVVPCKGCEIQVPMPYSVMVVGGNTVITGSLSFIIDHYGNMKLRNSSGTAYNITTVTSIASGVINALAI